MKGIADTGFLVAFANRNDRHHEWALALGEGVTDPLLTCEAVLAETAFHLRSVALTLALVRDGLVAVAFDCRENWPQLTTLARRYEDRSPDIADLCLIRMSELFPRHSVITVDRADFRVYRRNKRETIPIVCPPPTSPSALTIGTPPVPWAHQERRMGRWRAPLVAVLGGACTFGCAGASPPPPLDADHPLTASLPAIPLASFQNQALPGSLADDHGVRLGGFSDLYHDPRDGTNVFWTVPDRGPTVAGEMGLTHAVPEYNPALVKLMADASGTAVLQQIPISTPDGQPVSGLPNAGETAPLGPDGAPLAFNPNGLDPEGIVRVPDGTFWLAEEYGPSLVHLSRDGRVLERWMPRGRRSPGAAYPGGGGPPRGPWPPAARPRPGVAGRHRRGPVPLHDDGGNALDPRAPARALAPCGSCRSTPSSPGPCRSGSTCRRLRPTVRPTSPAG